jgi:hypothetical protein
VLAGKAAEKAAWSLTTFMAYLKLRISEKVREAKEARHKEPSIQVPCAPPLLECQAQSNRSGGVGRQGPGRRPSHFVEPPVRIPVPQISGALGRRERWDGCGGSPDRKARRVDSVGSRGEGRALGAKLLPFLFSFYRFVPGDSYSETFEQRTDEGDGSPML